MYIAAGGGDGGAEDGQVEDGGEGDPRTYMLNTRNEEKKFIFSLFCEYSNFEYVHSRRRRRRWRGERTCRRRTRRDPRTWERGKEDGIRFIFSLFCEYSNLEYAHTDVQVEDGGKGDARTYMLNKPWLGTPTSDPAKGEVFRFVVNSDTLCG